MTETKTRRAVWTDPTDSNTRGIVTEKVTDYTEADPIKDKVIRMGEEMAGSLPKLSFGHKDLGWIFIKGSSVERTKTFDVETVSLAHFSGYCTFEAAMAMVKQLERKIYVEFGKEPAAVRQDLSPTFSD